MRKLSILAVMLLVLIGGFLVGVMNIGRSDDPASKKDVVHAAPAPVPVLTAAARCNDGTTKFGPPIDVVRGIVAISLTNPPCAGEVSGCMFKVEPASAKVWVTSSYIFPEGPGPTLCLAEAHR